MYVQPVNCSCSSNSTTRYPNLPTLFLNACNVFISPSHRFAYWISKGPFFGILRFFPRVFFGFFVVGCPIQTLSPGLDMDGSTSDFRLQRVSAILAPFPLMWLRSVIAHGAQTQESCLWGLLTHWFIVFGMGISGGYGRTVGCHYSVWVFVKVFCFLSPVILCLFVINSSFPVLIQ